MTRTVVARLTATRNDSNVKLIIEVHQDASFHTFYHYYSQIGNRRSTKTEVRKASRNEGLRPHHRAPWMEPGLDLIGQSLMSGFARFASVKIRILRKRDYKRLLTAAPDVLGLTKTVSVFHENRHWERGTGIPVNFPIPAGFTSMKRRWEILTGR